MSFNNSPLLQKHNAMSKARKSSSWSLKLGALFASTLLALTAQAGTITGSGSTIVLNLNEGFTGTIGQSRETVFNAAAQIWADTIVSAVPIVIDAAFTGLSCNAYSGTLGSAGPNATYYLSAGGASYGMLDNTWYPVALFNALRGSDAAPGQADINASFNASMDNNNNCLNQTNWYYGLDHNPPGNDIDFFEVVLHEIAHGLGVLSMVSSNGAKPYGIMDSYSLHLKDKNVGAWTDLSNTQISTSMTDTGGLVWSGSEVNALAGDLTNGVNSGEVQMYAPYPYQSGSSVSHFDTALTPNELMEPQYTGDADLAHTIALFRDIGWETVSVETLVNEIPVISGQNALSTDEETAITLVLSNLTVTDSDNSFPADFTLSVAAGSNYSVSGATLTPATDFVGTLTVPVTVNDGSDDSASYNLSVTVTNVNDQPQITGQSALSLDEDTSLTLNTSDFTLVDPDDSSFTLTVASGMNYSVSGNTITPVANYNGTLTVPVTVNDGDIDGDSFPATVTVNALNDAPVISTAPDYSIDEDTSLTLLVTDFSISDVDSSSFSLNLSAGDNYTVSGTTLTPDANYFGDLAVPVTVSDGSANSSVLNLTVTVESINDVPTITAGPTVSIDEGSYYDLQVGNFSVTDNDSTSFTLNAVDGANYSVSGNRVTPLADFSGDLTVPLTVSDGTDVSPTFNLLITVNNINDQPQITGQSPLTLNEDGNLTLSTSDFTLVDPDDSSFTLTVASGVNYSVSGNTVTPVANYNGDLTVNVTVNDGDVDSANFPATVTVNAVNDAPVISTAPAYSIDEDTSLTLLVTDFSISDVDSSSFSLNLSAGDNYTVSGTTLTPDENYFGDLTVPVTVSDGTANSGVVPVTVTVESINDVPTITAGPTVSIDEGSYYDLQVGNFSVTDNDSTSFTLNAVDGANYSVSGNRVTPLADFSGDLTVPLTVSDGTDVSPTFNLLITVNNINDQPQITGQSTLTLNEDGSLTISKSDFTVVDPDDSSFTLSVGNGANFSVSGTTISPVADYNGTLTVPVTVNDGAMDSVSYAATVTVNAMNDAPVISAAPAYSLDENTSLTLVADDFTISDVDSSSFSLNLGGGDHYTLNGMTLTPDTNYFGYLTVPVTVTDGSASSVLNLTVYVDSLNDAPTITAGPTVSFDEDSNYELRVTDFTISDNDSDVFTLNVSAGANYSVSGTRVTPAADFSGILTVSVAIHDGIETGPTFNLLLTVNNINDQPQITDQSTLSMNEDGNLTLSTSDFTLADPDPDDTSSTLILTVGAGTNYSVSGNTITPVADYNGTLTVPVTVNDGEMDSVSYAATVTVNAVNDAPVIAPVAAISLMEDGSYDFALTDVTVTDPDSDSATFTLSVEPGSNYQLVANSLYPDANYSGLLNVGLSVYDGSLNSASVTVQVQVTPVNDAPLLSGTPVTSVVINEDYSVQFSGSDVEGDNLLYSVVSDHAWLSIDSSGLLTGYPLGGDIAEETVRVQVNDGDITTEQRFVLTVLDVISADLGISLTADKHLVGLSMASKLELKITNSGPTPLADGYLLVTLDTPASFDSLDSDCFLNGENQVRCDFTDVSEPLSKALTVTSAQAALVNAEVELFAAQSDPDSSNDWADTTLVFQAEAAAPEASAPVLSGIDTRAVAVADVTDDGQAELVFANGASQADQLFAFSSGFDSLIPVQSLSESADGHDVIAVDLNGDGLIDLVFANSGANQVYFNQGGGTYAAPVTLGLADSRAVIAVDLNGDDFADLAFANADGANSIYLNNQADGFIAADLLGGSESVALAQLDANGDGWSDLVFANRDDDDYVYLNRGADQSVSVFTNTVLIVGAQQNASNAVRVADLDGDGVANDILIGQQTSAHNSSIEIYQPTGSGQFNRVTELAAGDVRALSLGDYNGDGSVDIGVVNDDGLVQIHTQEQGAFQSALIFASAGASVAVLSDLDADGRADLIVTAASSATSRVYFSAGPDLTDTDASRDTAPEEDTPVTVITVTETSGTNDGTPTTTTTEVIVVKSGSLSGLLVLLGVFLLWTRRADGLQIARAQRIDH